MSTESEIGEVVARVRQRSLTVCESCGGEGYTDTGKSACAACYGAGVTTPELSARLAEAARWDGLTDAIREIIGASADWPSHGNAPLAIAASFQIMRMDLEQAETDEAAA